MRGKRLQLLPTSLVDNSAVTTARTSVDEIERELLTQLRDAIARAKTSEATFMAFEQALVTTVQLLGRLLLMVFLSVREERERAKTPERITKGRSIYRRRPAQARNLNTIFGVVRYFRTYLRGPHGHGFHPLDIALGLTADRMSMNVLGLAARLATTLSFARVHAVLGWFLGAAPSTEVIENTVLGLGRRTNEWFERAPTPDDDGEVLILQFDSKGAPTATQTELERRRGPRRPNAFPHSARHRGRDRRQRYGAKPRRKKGDKSKNARMATIVVMYTLRRAKDGTATLLGPVNRRVYASFAPKRHVFAVARREADKRGFTKDSGKLVQIVTDGDDDLATYGQEFFPEAIHTVDVMHVIEYLYLAGECLYSEGSEDLTVWIELQKERLYGGKEEVIISELKRRFDRIPLTGPGNKGKRGRLEKAIKYLDKRLVKMNYRDLLERDLEIGSGAVEGAVKTIIGARFDFGGSRWIRERAEPLLQLRCIEANGDWEVFIAWVHDDHRRHARRTGDRIRVQQNTPSALPILGVAA
jgi:hypothetical protein